MSKRIIKIKLTSLAEKAMDVPLSDELDDLRYAPTTLREVHRIVAENLRDDVPFIIFGPPGFGKTQMIKSMAQNIPGFPVDPKNIIVMPLASLGAEDLRGLPKIVDIILDGKEEKEAELGRSLTEDERRQFIVSVTDNTLPDWLVKILTKPDDNFILFLDEINHAQPDVLNALYGIVLERNFDGHDFTKNVRIAGAANDEKYNRDVNALSKPLLSRFYVLDITDAVKLDQESYEEFLYKAIEGSKVPKEWVKMITRSKENVGNARSVTNLLERWAVQMDLEADRLSPDPRAIPMPMYSRFNAIYQEKILNPLGSEKHFQAVDEIQKYVSELRKKEPDFFNSLKSYSMREGYSGNKKIVSRKTGTSFGAKLNEAGIEHLRQTFNKYPDEWIMTAIDGL